MAQKRMFSKLITNSDEFLSLPDSSQVLYFHLSMNADDDGFVNNCKSIIRMTGTKEDDLKLLIAKMFIIPFETGIIVIRHWRINNYLQKDRIKPTIYQDEYNKLNIESDGVYNLYTKCIHSIDKNRIEENRIEENNNARACVRVKENKNYFNDDELNNIFLEFLELRKKIKAVNSERAINMLLKKLSNYDDDTKKKMIERSILNSWKDVYEIKQEKTSYEKRQQMYKELEEQYNEN